jgi:bifunctional DNA-binding transcriptional regulator/antitoxin component of YhaV-PrlF toxin-antitoxin module
MRQSGETFGITPEAEKATITDVGRGEGANIPKAIRKKYGIEKGDTVFLDPGRGNDNELVLVFVE